MPVQKDWKERSRRKTLERQRLLAELLVKCKTEIPFLEWSIQYNVVRGQSPGMFTLQVHRDWGFPDKTYIVWEGLESKNVYGGWGLSITTGGDTLLDCLKNQIANYRKVVESISSYAERFNKLERDIQGVKDASISR